MLAALLALPLLVTARDHDFNNKFESTERMGLDVPLTRTLKFLISNNLCSGVITSPLFDEDCQQPLAMLVTAKDNHIPEVTLEPELNKATIMRKRNEEDDCPGEAPVIVKMACSVNNGTRRNMRESSEARRLPEATDEDLKRLRVKNL